MGPSGVVFFLVGAYPTFLGGYRVLLGRSSSLVGGYPAFLGGILSFWGGLLPLSRGGILPSWRVSCLLGCILSFWGGLILPSGVSCLVGGILSFWFLGVSWYPASLAGILGGPLRWSWTALGVPALSAGIRPSWGYPAFLVVVALLGRHPVLLRRSFSFPGGPPAFLGASWPSGGVPWAFCVFLQWVSCPSGGYP